MTEYIQLNDDTFEDLFAAEYAVLVIGKSDCGYCQKYNADIADLVESRTYGDVVFGKLALDKPGSTQFKRANPWISRLKELPYTVLYRSGEPVDKFAASKASYLKERLQEIFLQPTDRKQIP